MILTSVDLPAPLSPIRPSDLARLEREIDAVQRLDRAEMLRDPVSSSSAIKPPNTASLPLESGRLR